MKILIVEDQARLADFLMKSLSERAYTVKCAPNCAQARDALCESSYDAIVLDIGLPDGDGFELLRQWRAGGFNEPVLILSARDTVQDRIKGLDLGADDYLPKPFQLVEIEIIANRIIEHLCLLEDNRRLSRKLLSLNEDYATIDARLQNIEAMIGSLSSNLLESQKH